MSKYIKINRGLDIKLEGEAERVYANGITTATVAIKPTDIVGLTPKLLVKAGDKVKAGTPIFYSKENERIKFAAPVSGEIAEIVRGEKRKILEVKILADKEIGYVEFEKSNPKDVSRDLIIERLLNSGVWPLLRQRPFATIANPSDKPKAVFVSTFDSAPLGPDNDFILHGQGEDFQAGLDVLGKLTDGKVHLNVNADSKSTKVFTNSTGVQINHISGPHPAGNVGVQIHHLDPINKGEVVWTVTPQDVLIIGRLFKHGRYDASKVIALTGSQVKQPRYYKVVCGTSVKSILANSLKEGKNRIISGNVLTGSKINEEGYLGYYDNQITVIPEGDEPEFMGWLAPGFDKLSMSRTYFSWLNPAKKYDLNTNIHGEERPFVVTGEYEKVFPFNIYPVQLLKSVLVEDIDLMEKLGIYEVAEEDFALCEFVCTSKINSQKIIRKGLDVVKKECS